MQRVVLNFCRSNKLENLAKYFAGVSILVFCLSPTWAKAALTEKFSVEKIQTIQREITIEDLIKLASFRKQKTQATEGSELADSHLKERVNFYADELPRMPAFQLSDLRNLEVVAKKNRVASNGSVYDVQALKRGENSFNSDPPYEVLLKSELSNPSILPLRPEEIEISEKEEGQNTLDIVSIDVLNISNAIETNLDEIDVNLNQQSYLEVNLPDSLSSAEEIRLYSKSSSVLKADSTNLRFEVLSTGETEIVIASREHAKFIKVHVGSSDEISNRKMLFGKKSKETLVDLNTMVDPSEPASEWKSENITTEVSEITSQAFDGKDELSRPQVEVGMSAVEAAKVENRPSPVSVNLVAMRSSENVDQRVLNLKVLDYRSDVRKNLFYPIANAKIQITGLAYPLLTDAKGEVSLRGIPEASILTARIEVPGGEYRPTIVELDLNANEKTQMVYLMRYDYLNLLTAAASTVQNAFSSSACLTIVDDSGKGVDGYDVKMDVVAQGPYYFNALNYIDASLKQSHQDGRVCFFNIEAGPYFMRAYKDEELIFAKPFFSAPGFHDQSFIKLEENSVRFKTAAVAIAEVSNQLDSKDPSSLYEIQDSSEIRMLANDEVLESTEVPELVATSVDRINSLGHFFVNQTAEFETSLQRIKSNTDGVEAESNHSEAMLLLPRGFLAEMADSAMTKFDYQLGHVYVEFGQVKNMSEGGLTIKLLDMAGNRVGESWYFSDLPVSKNIFYNVEPGLYQVIVEDRSGAWLAAESVFVYNEAVSVLNVGSRLQVLTR